MFISSNVSIAAASLDIIAFNSFTLESSILGASDTVTGGTTSTSLPSKISPFFNGPSVPSALTSLCITIPTELNLFDWAKEVEKRGAGEILFTSMNHDGTKNGFANEALAKLSEELNIPIIASGGAGNVQHFIDTFKIGKADAALAASVFHFGEIRIPELKKELKNNNIEVRL